MPDCRVMDTLPDGAEDTGTLGGLLAVFAHPDDESYLAGGTLARYAASGVRVALLCATLSEAGDIADPVLAARETLPSVREAELRAAAACLGLAETHLLGYHDGSLASVDFPEGVERVSAIMAAQRPRVVLTFGPEGVYGHPDHVAIHRWAKEAFHRYRATEPALAPRLYYVAPPRSWYRAVSERTRLRSVPDRYGPRVEVLGVPDELVTTRVAVGEYVTARLAAIRAHRSQLFADHPFATLPDVDLQELLAVEYFTRGWPVAAPREPVEADLFAA